MSPNLYDIRDAVHAEVGEFTDVALAILAGQDFDDENRTHAGARLLSK